MITGIRSDQSKIDKLRAKDEGSYIFACQAAVPLVLTPDLLYQLWNNFKHYRYNLDTGGDYKISHIAVSDLILSDFCKEVGYELYEIEKGVRDILLSDLDHELGEKRKNTIATFLEDYALLEYRNTRRKNLKDIHLLTAQSILDPGEMERQIIDRINSAQTDAEKINYLLLHQNLLPVGFKSDLAEISRNVNSNSLSPILVEEENPGTTGVLNVTLPAGLQNKIRTISRSDIVKERDGEVPVQVSVSNGDLFYSRYPVLVGHFSNDGITSAEKKIDEYCGHALSERRRLNIYPGALGTSEVFLNSSDEFKGAIVIGLGEPGELGSYQLIRACEEGAIRYMMALSKSEDRKEKADTKRGTGISVLLIGTSYGYLSIENTVRSIIQGVLNADNKIKELKPEEGVRPIDRIEFVELYEDKSLQCLYIVNKIEAENGWIDIVVPEKSIRIMPGARKNAYVEDKSGWWSRLNIEMRTQIDSRTKHVLRFSSNTGSAKTEQYEINIAPEIIDSLLHEMSTNNNWDSRVAKTIFELLIPNELKYEIKRQANILWILDISSAAYPWELLQDTSTDTLPLCCKSGMIRQLAQENFRIGITAADGNRALIIGDPGLDGFAPQLPGAVQEASLVSDLLRKAGYGMITTSKQNSSPEIIKALFETDYKIIHLSGHGISGEEPGKPSGMLIGNNIFLTSAEISQMSRVPELIFINCCFLGRIDARAELAQNRNKFAANIGVQLLRSGVKALVVAGWAIDDAAAIYFTKIFYEKLLAGDNFGDSIKEARLRTFQDYPNTNTWGAYQCYGDPFYSIVDQISEITNTTMPAESTGQIPGYKHDIYISYSHDAMTSNWIEDIFLPDLKNYLHQELGEMPKIFIENESLTTGQDFQASIANNLARSKILVAILTPGYIRNSYCLAEWLTFTERSKLSNSSLAIPIVLRDGDYLRNTVVSNVQWVDFSSFNYLGSSFKENQRYEDFSKQISALASRLSSVLHKIPAFDADWPLIDLNKAAEIIAKQKEGQEKSEAIKTVVKVIKIFITSSSEVGDDLEVLIKFINGQSRHLQKEEGIYLEVIQWEPLIGAVYQSHLQSAYSEALKDADISVALLPANVDPDAIEQFDTAFKHFKETGRPVLCTYLKEETITSKETKEGDVNHMNLLRIRLTKFRHFPSSYTDSEDLILKFSTQLEKVIEQYSKHTAKKNNGFYTEADIRELVATTGILGKADTVRDTLLIFETSRQHTWMVATNRFTYILLDDEETRAKNQLIQTFFNKTATLPLETRDSTKFKRSRVVKFAAMQSWWYYSQKLFPTNERLTAAVQNLLGNMETL